MRGHAPGIRMMENVGACPWNEGVLKMWGHAPRIGIIMF